MIGRRRRIIYTVGLVQSRTIEVKNLQLVSCFVFEKNAFDSIYFIYLNIQQKFLNLNTASTLVKAERKLCNKLQRANIFRNRLCAGKAFFWPTQFPKMIFF
jgi:hypothetical protein